MNNSKVQNVKGFRDFLPAEKKARDFVAQKIKTVFERFGFEPIETPTLEYASLLLGKYGAEADKLVYSFEDRGGRSVALRYDQTVPSARFLTQYQNDLPKYFRRYQIQNVFRAEKPQKGRYREFTQCDADIFGSTDPVADAEILAVYYAIYREIGFDSLVLRINDRQTLLDNLSPFARDTVSVFSIIQSIDKLDKLPQERVFQELTAKGLNEETVNQIFATLSSVSESESLRRIRNAALDLGVPAEALVFTPTLARGLDYYTGLIFEGVVTNYGVGSVGGGGRYDQLIGQLSGVSIPAVGFGLGFDRTVEAALEVGLAPTFKATSKVLVARFDESTTQNALHFANTLRNSEVPAEVYPELDKLAKQFKLANQKGIPFVAIIGPEEAANGLVTLKNMLTSEQQSLTIDEAISHLVVNE